MDKATVESVMALAFELARIREQHGAQSGMYLSEVRALRAEVERLAAQSAPTEIHADTPRHELLPRLRRLASDFQSHPLSRSISECEEAGIAMAEAAKQIEMLCRTRNTVVNHSGRMRKEIAALTEHRDFLLREIAKIDGDPGNACHYAIEAISAVCADLAEPVPPLPEPEPTYTDDLELRYAEAREERDHLRAVLRAQSPAQVERLAAQSARDDAALYQTIGERDNYHKWADKLADGIATHLGIDIGEHTAGAGANNPWANALEAIQAVAQSAPLAQQAARILRAAGAADVVGLMAMIRAFGNARAREMQSPVHENLRETERSFAALESALRMALAPKGWQPIETAPKEWILLLGYFNESGKWRTVRGEWFCQEEIDDQWEFPENGSPGWYETCVNADEPPNCWPIEPTHWMPLPTPPKD